MMKKDNIIWDKSKGFAVRIIKLCQFLSKDQREFVLSKQLLRSGTSIGANVREAHHAMSNAEFRAKMNIALKEASETEYWLELLQETGYLTKEQFDSIYQDSNEINKLLISIIKKLNQKSHL